MRWWIWTPSLPTLGRARISQRWMASPGDVHRWINADVDWGVFCADYLSILRSQVNGHGKAPWQSAAEYAGKLEGDHEVLAEILKPVAGISDVPTKATAGGGVWEGPQVVEVRLSAEGVVGLGGDVKEGDLARIMGGKVRVQMCRIVRPKKGRNGVSFALVRFRTKEFAAAAVRTQGKTISGKPLVVVPTDKGQEEEGQERSSESEDEEGGESRGGSADDGEEEEDRGGGGEGGQNLMLTS